MRCPYWTNAVKRRRVDEHQIVLQIHTTAVSSRGLLRILSRIFTILYFTKSFFKNLQNTDRRMDDDKQKTRNFSHVLHEKLCSRFILQRWSETDHLANFHKSIICIQRNSTVAGCQLQKIKPMPETYPTLAYVYQEPDQDVLRYLAQCKYDVAQTPHRALIWNIVLASAVLNTTRSPFQMSKSFWTKLLDFLKRLFSHHYFRITCESMNAA